MKRYLFVFSFLIPFYLFAQYSVGDYKTNAGVFVNWGDASAWGVWNGSSFDAAASYPSGGSGYNIWIRDVMIVSMNVDVTLPSSGNLFIIDGGSGVLLSIPSTKTLTNGSSGNILGASNITVDGTYEHAGNGGTVPSLVWNSSSSLLLSGITNVIPSGLTQSFTNVELNSPSMTATLNFSDIQFSGELKLTNSGTGCVCIDDLREVNGDITIETNSKLTIDYTGRLTMNGTLTNNGGNANLIIKGDNTGSGSMIYNSSINGTYNQYITDDVWHLIGIPVNKGTGATLGAFNPASGDGYMRAYETGNSDWGNYMFTETDQLNVGQGYEYWTTVNNTVSLTGTFNTGNVNLTMSSSGNQYNLLANPYPCAIDWESVADKTHALSQSVYYYANTAGTNGYAVYNGSTNSGSYGATQYIPPFQGFFVEQTSATDMDFSNSNKAHPNKAFYKSVEEEGIYDRIRLQLTQDTLWSETVIVHSDEATNDYDEMVDTKMLPNNYIVAPEIYSIAGDENIMINGIGDYPAVVPLELNIIQSGKVAITLTEMSDMLESTRITLEDKENNMFYILDDNFQGISFEVDSAIISDRFFVHYANVSNTNEENSIETEIYSYNKVVYISKLNEDADVRIYNMLGQQVYSGRIQNQEMNRIQLDQPKGYYIINIQTDENLVNRKLYID